MLEKSTTYSKRLKPQSDYTGRLNKLRKIKGISDNFASNTNNLIGMYSQPIENYFNKSSIQVSLKPLPKQIKDVDSCLKYLQLWDQYFENCQKEIID